MAKPKPTDNIHNKARWRGIHLKIQDVSGSIAQNILNRWFPSPRAAPEDINVLLILRCFQVCTLARVAEQAPAGTPHGRAKEPQGRKQETSQHSWAKDYPLHF